MKNSWNDPFPNCKNCGGPFRPGTCAYCGTYTDDRVELKVTINRDIDPKLEILMKSIVSKMRIWGDESDITSLLDMS